MKNNKALIVTVLLLGFSVYIILSLQNEMSGANRDENMVFINDFENRNIELNLIEKSAYLVALKQIKNPENIYLNKFSILENGDFEFTLYPLRFAQGFHHKTLNISREFTGFEAYVIIDSTMNLVKCIQCLHY